MNTTKSEQIKAGLRKSFQTGESAKASTVCYGYKVTSEGKLVAYPTEAIIVFHIFERFADGDSLGKIAASLARMKVKSPTGKEYNDGAVELYQFEEDSDAYKEIESSDSVSGIPVAAHKDGIALIFANNETDQAILDAFNQLQFK